MLALTFAGIITASLAFAMFMIMHQLGAEFADGLAVRDLGATA